MGTGPGGGHGDRRMLCRGPAGGPSRARHEAGRGPGRSSRLRAGRAVVVRAACALRAGPRARRVRPPGRPPPRPSAVRAPANSGSRLPECSIPHVTHGISGSKAETGRPTRSGGRPMTALTRRRPGSQGGQRRSSRRGPLLPPSIAAPPPLASSWSLSPEAPSLLHLLLPCARSAAGVGLGTSRWDSTVRRWPRALPGRGGIFAGTGTEGEDRAVGERGPPAWVWVPAAPGASSLRLGRLGCGLGPSDGTCLTGPRSPCPRPHASPSVKRGSWPHPALRLQEPPPATDQGKSRHGVPPQRAVAPDLTLGGPTRGPARLRGLFASPAA